MKELKLEIQNVIEEELKNKIEGGAINNDNNKYPSKKIKSTRTCCLCKIEKNKDCFYNTGGLCKGCSSEKFTCTFGNTSLNRSSLRKHMKRPHNNHNNNS